MLKKTYCRADLDLTIAPEDPILIKSGFASVSSSDMPFVTTYRFGKPEVYLPGSSLKGVIRSHAEKICRTLKDNSVCVPYKRRENGISAEEEKEISCGERFQERKKKAEIPSADAYRYSCPACRIFGSTSFVGRCHISDAYVTEEWKKANGGPPRPELRDGVAIDRHTGGAASGAKFDWEVITRGDFLSHITLRNFELWQLGLLGYILRDFEEKFIRIGAGKSRGLGRVSGRISNFTLTYFKDPGGLLRGLAELASPEERESYGLFCIPAGSETEKKWKEFALPGSRASGFPFTFDVTAHKEALFAAAAPVFNAYISGAEWLNRIMEYAKA